MALAGFRDLSGQPVRLADIDIVNDAARFNCSPATLAMLIDSAKGREGIEFSASQVGKPLRQLLLESGDYYPTTGEAMAAHMGTMKHQQINVARHLDLIVEQRFTSKRNPRLSGQIDHAVIVDVDTSDDYTDTLIVDLYDLKTVKWYSATLIAKDVWASHPDYAWQLNLCAALMEENGLPDREMPANIRVRNLYLECIPADSSYKQQGEAARLGLPEFQKILVPVERVSADETYAVYEKALAARDEAIAAGWAPICEDRWSNKTITDLRCKFYCSVREECIALAKAKGEAHPLVKADAEVA